MVAQPTAVQHSAPTPGFQGQAVDSDHPPPPFTPIASRFG